MLKQVGIEILATQMCVTSSCLDREDTTLNVQQGNIESTAAQVVDENVPLLLRLSGSETIGNSGGSGLVDDTEDI
jgi:hypothetical protein